MAGFDSCGYKNMIQLGDEDFGEEDVWSYGIEKEDSSLKLSKSSSSSCGAWQFPSAPRIIDKASNPKSSAPVKIPDWSRIYCKNRDSRNESWIDGGCGMGYGDGDHAMLPPHEWLSRKHARSQICSFSMCEGIGRTLKGRDLSKVRNAILTKTGFLE